MSTSSTGKNTSPRQQRAKPKGETSVESGNSTATTKAESQPTLTKDSVDKGEHMPGTEKDSNASSPDKAKNGSSTSVPVKAEAANAGKLEVKDTMNVSGLRPIAATSFEIAETVSISGIRPIGVSNLEISETYNVLGNRPVSVSHLNVVETVNIMGIRPITGHEFEVVDTINLSGIRPIGASTIVVSDSYSIMGNRPVASNETDDYGNLMGFLD